jgi:hypothetical protein
MDPRDAGDILSVKRKTTDSRPANGPPVNALISLCTHELQLIGFFSPLAGAAPSPFGNQLLERTRQLQWITDYSWVEVIDGRER